MNREDYRSRPPSLGSHPRSWRWSVFGGYITWGEQLKNRLCDVRGCAIRERRDRAGTREISISEEGKKIYILYTQKGYICRYYNRRIIIFIDISCVLCFVVINWCQKMRLFLLEATRNQVARVRSHRETNQIYLSILVRFFFFNF